MFVYLHGFFFLFYCIYVFSIVQLPSPFKNEMSAETETRKYKLDAFSAVTKRQCIRPITLDDLPNELQLPIFSQLTQPCDIRAMQLVCRSSKTIADDESCWRARCEALFGCGSGCLPQDGTVKSTFWRDHALQWYRCYQLLRKMSYAAAIDNSFWGSVGWRNCMTSFSAAIMSDHCVVRARVLGCFMANQLKVQDFIDRKPALYGTEFEQDIACLKSHPEVKKYTSFLISLLNSNTQYDRASKWDGLWYRQRQLIAVKQKTLSEFWKAFDDAQNNTYVNLTQLLQKGALPYYNPRLLDHAVIFNSKTAVQKLLEHGAAPATPRQLLCFFHCCSLAISLCGFYRWVASVFGIHSNWLQHCRIMQLVGGYWSRYMNSMLLTLLTSPYVCSVDRKQQLLQCAVVALLSGNWPCLDILLRLPLEQELHVLLDFSSQEKSKQRELLPLIEAVTTEFCRYCGWRLDDTTLTPLYYFNRALCLYRHRQLQSITTEEVIQFSMRCLYHECAPHIYGGYGCAIRYQQEFWEKHKMTIVYEELLPNALTTVMASECSNVRLYNRKEVAQQLIWPYISPTEVRWEHVDQLTDFIISRCNRRKT